jgi:hypothetical protein
MKINNKNYYCFEYFEKNTVKFNILFSINKYIIKKLRKNILVLFINGAEDNENS